MSSVSPAAVADTAEKLQVSASDVSEGPDDTEAAFALAQATQRLRAADDWHDTGKIGPALQALKTAHAKASSDLKTDIETKIFQEMPSAESNAQ